MESYSKFQMLFVLLSIFLITIKSSETRNEDFSNVNSDYPDDPDPMKLLIEGIKRGDVNLSEFLGEIKNVLPIDNESPTSNRRDGEYFPVSSEDHGPPQLTDQVPLDNLPYYMDEPYKYIGKHIIGYPGGQTFHTCAGVIVSQDQYITAAHCVVNTVGSVYNPMMFVPRYYSNDATNISPPPTHLYFKEAVAVFLKYHTSNDQTLDYALVRVGSNEMGGSEPLGHFGFAQVANTRDLQSNCSVPETSVRLFGYPFEGHSDFDGRMLVETNTTVWFESDSWGTGFETHTRGMFAIPSELSSGSSGGGVFNRNNPNLLCGLITRRMNYFKFNLIPKFDSMVDEMLNFDMNVGGETLYWL